MSHGPGTPLFLPPPYGRPAAPHRGQAPTGPDQALRADVRRVSLTPGRRLRTRVAGIFLFLPLLAQLQFDQLVTQAGYPGSRMVPATSALRSLLALKLLDKERRSHISDFNFDEALGLFAGLNILPKTTFATDYSYRTQREYQHRFLAGWLTHLALLLLPDASAFCLDFHPILYRGDPRVWTPITSPNVAKRVPVSSPFSLTSPTAVFYAMPMPTSHGPTQRG